MEETGKTKKIKLCLEIMELGIELLKNELNEGGRIQEKDYSQIHKEYVQGRLDKINRKLGFENGEG